MNDTHATNTVEWGGSLTATAAQDPHLINPYVRSAAYFPWHIRNRYRNIAYHTRLFAIRKHGAIVQYGDVETTVPAESLLILSPGIDYDFQNADEGNRFDLYCCNFDLTEQFWDTHAFVPPDHTPDYDPQKIVDTTVFPPLTKPLLLTAQPALCELVQTIYERFHTGLPYAQEMCSGLVKAVLFQALQVAETHPAPHTGGSEVARQTLAYIRDHFADPIDEGDIAAAMHFHPYYLTRLTQKYYGTTPYQYLRQCRYEHALRLLQYTDMPIGQVAQSCGYTSQAHFSRVITQMSGLSPTAIRKKGGGAV